MTYKQAIDFIYSRRKFEKSSGHERIERLLQLAGNPHKRLRFVHVAGTNGKGSVSTAAASVLQAAGYTTGLFTSPFVICFGERIRVNGELIPESAVASITSFLYEKIKIMAEEGLYPTVFEVTTALAMCYFDDMNCDIVILEAGIGGGRDSTSVIPSPVVAVITSVSLDHREALGDTVEEIAREKCGIIKGGCSVVSYPFEKGDFDFIPQSPEAARVIEQQCREKGSRLFVPDTKRAECIRSDLGGNELNYDGLHLVTGQCGFFQSANLLTAAQVCRVLENEGFLITDRDIEQGISRFFIPGRLECVSREPFVVLDAGHNEGAMRELAALFEAHTKGKSIVALCSFMKDKDYKSAIRLLAPFCREMVFTLSDTVRGELPEELCRFALDYCESSFCEDVQQAFEKALSLLGEGDMLFVGGSFYLVSEIRKKYLDR